MPALDQSFSAVLTALAERYGRPVPGPAAGGDDPFRALLETLLARSVAPRKAAKALDGLAEAGLLDPVALAGADPAELRDLLRESGVAASAKAAAPLLRLARWLVERHGGSADGLGAGPAAAPTDALREELVSLNGIGPATADALLLFALHRPVYPVDRATYRVLVRHDWLDPSAGYDEARELVERPSGGDPATLERLSAWLERVGREYCRAGVPQCAHCPLRPFLPEGGPAFSDRETAME